MAKRMSVWTAQTGLCVDCGRKVSAPPTNGSSVPATAVRSDNISVWTAICNVVLAVSIYLESDEKKVEAIFHALSAMGKGLKTKDADLAPLCEELFTKVCVMSMSWTVWRARPASSSVVLTCVVGLFSAYLLSRWCGGVVWCSTSVCDLKLSPFSAPPTSPLCCPPSSTYKKRWSNQNHTVS